MAIKIEFKHILQAIPAAFTVVRESMKLWKKKNRSCKKCRSWSKTFKQVDRVCTNARFKASVNTIHNLDNITFNRPDKDEILTNETFCCCYFKK